MDAPKGYKPVKHRVCGTTLWYVKKNVLPQDPVRAKDCLSLEGEMFYAGDKIPRCPHCRTTWIDDVVI